MTIRWGKLFRSKTVWLQILDTATLVVPLVGGTMIGEPELGILFNGLTVASRVVAKGPLVVLKDAAEEP